MVSVGIAVLISMLSRGNFNPHIRHESFSELASVLSSIERSDTVRLDGKADGSSLAPNKT